jgi:hypothetical protein
MNSNNFQFSQRSLKNLVGVHPDLVKCAELALSLSTVDFGVIEGLRAQERQKELFALGATKTMNSRHLTGHAIDVMAYVGSQGRWDWPLYEKINQVFQEASLALDIPVTWGGSWRSFKDGPHFELPWDKYPK